MVSKTLAYTQLGKIVFEISFEENLFKLFEESLARRDIGY